MANDTYTSHNFLTELSIFSGVARAFPGGRPAHPEPQIEEENEEKLRKVERKSRRMRKNWGNVAFLPTQGWESDYTPEYFGRTLRLRTVVMWLQELANSRAAKPIHCAQNVKTVRFCTKFNKSINNIFLICQILWHFQDGRHWPWEFHMGQKLKHTPISLQIVSNCLSCHKDSKNV